MSGRAVFSEGDVARPNNAKPTSGARMQQALPVKVGEAAFL